MSETDERGDDAMVELVFNLLPANEPPSEYAPGHVTITTGQATGSSRPDHHFMVANSQMDLLSGMKAFPVSEQELVRAILGGTRDFLRTYANMLAEEEAELAAVTEEFAAAFRLEECL